jgi:uncharacterized protein (UPF0335 family)
MIANITTPTPVAQSGITANSIIDKLVPIYTEIETLTEDAKEILKDAKESGMDSAMLSKVAKAKVSMKLGELTEKTEKLLELIDSL